MTESASKTSIWQWSCIHSHAIVRPICESHLAIDMAYLNSNSEKHPKLVYLSDNLQQTNPALYYHIKGEMDAIRKLVFETARVESDWDDSYTTAYEVEQRQTLRSHSIAEIDLNIEFHQFEKDQKRISEKHVTTVCLAENTAPKASRRTELHIKLLRMRSPHRDYGFDEAKVHCQLKILKSHEDTQKTVGKTEYVKARNEETLRFVFA